MGNFLRKPYEFEAVVEQICKVTKHIGSADSYNTVMCALFNDRIVTTRHIGVWYLASRAMRDQLPNNQQPKLTEYFILWASALGERLPSERQTLQDMIETWTC